MCYRIEFDNKYGQVVFQLKLTERNQSHYWKDLLLAQDFCCSLFIAFVPKHLMLVLVASTIFHFFMLWIPHFCLALFFLSIHCHNHFLNHLLLHFNLDLISSLSLSFFFFFSFLWWNHYHQMNLTHLLKFDLLAGEHMLFGSLFCCLKNHKNA